MIHVNEPLVLLIDPSTRLICLLSEVTLARAHGNSSVGKHR